MKISLTKTEIEALCAAVGNIDPCMFDEMGDPGEKLFAAWVSGREKLLAALERLDSSKIIGRRAGN